ncbi:uracil-DNA degrading factor [Anticarsia gemmatalis]|uniref:uracil-DNA degrading factor n=1 Tax=Anticarsia gemmatalis TaxID=129554 RepID=UPI003F76DEAA
MGKDDKEDSGFGFKDKAKAEETLRLLEAHERNYQRLTVRGLLGRAKRVLSMTKAEDKIKNIKEAMEVFETWLAQLGAGKDNKTDDKQNRDKKEKKQDKKEDKKSSDKESSSDVEMEQDKPEKAALPADTVPGLGFKDADTARASLAALQGRDPDYQKLAVKGLLGRAKRVLTCTRDETKLSNIKEAMSILEQFVDDFESQHLGRQNNAYVSLGVVRTAQERADNVTEQQKSFIEAYKSVRGEYKRLRTVAPEDGGKTWDILRNDALKLLKEKYADAKLFNEKDEPTAEHLDMLLWAYSPEAARVKKCVPETKDETTDSRKRRSSARDDSPAKRTRD